MLFPSPEPETDPAALISREMERIHVESYGTGAHSIRTFLIDDSFVMCVIDNKLTTAEKTLLDGGKGETVKAMRMAYQQAIEPAFVALVERAVGRTVEAFISHVHMEPMFSVELFRLAPRSGPQPAG